MDFLLSPITILCLKKTTNLLTENFALLVCFCYLVLILEVSDEDSTVIVIVSFRILYCKCGYIRYCVGMEAPHGWQMHISMSILCLTSSYSLVFSFRSALQYNKRVSYMPRVLPGPILCLAGQTPLSCWSRTMSFRC